MDYRLAKVGVVRLEDGATITRDMDAWEDYRAWLRGGGVPEPMEIVIPPRWSTLDDGRAEVWATCRARRDALEAGGFPYRDHPMDSDPRAVQRINTAVQAAQAAAAMGQPFGIGWTCMDGHVLALDAAGMMGMPVALAIYANGLHQVAREVKTRIFEAPDFGTLEAIEAEVEAWGRPEPVVVAGEGGGMP
jgi:hypothetical protein